MLVLFNINGDERGSLVAFENKNNIPFDIKRVYYIYGTNTDVERGFHAHRDLEQLVICVSGSCTFILDDGNSRHEYKLNSPNCGVLINGVKWREMKDFSDDCVLLVLASKYYNASDYIHDYTEFKQVVENKNDTQLSRLP